MLLNHFAVVQLIGCADGLEYLHGCNVVHGDLKCQNVLITLSSDGTPIPLICDFGTSRIMGMRGYTTQSLWGTQGFLAPELIEESESARAIPTSDSDVWAFGVMAFVSSMFSLYWMTRLLFVAVAIIHRPGKHLD